MKKNILIGLLFVTFFCCCSEYKGKENHKNLLEPPLNYQHDPLKLGSYLFITSNMDSLEHLSKTGQNVKDVYSIDKTYLVENIDQAVKASKCLIDKKIISIQDFNEYVLPYRINSSKIDNWRKDVLLKYHNKYSVTLINNEVSLINTCNLINNELKTWFKFGAIKADDGVLSYSDLCSNKQSSCVGMAYLAAYTLRGLGIPVAIDYAPVWGNVNGGHTWNSLVTRTKKVNSFLGAENNIGSYSPLNLVSNESPSLSTYKKPGKIYRFTFSVQKKSLAYKYGNSGSLPSELTETRIIDVTKDYVPVKDIIFKPLKIHPKFLFICNYNSGAWTPVMAALFGNNQYLFRDMGRDMLYGAFSYDQHSLNSFDYPVYVDVSGKSIVLSPNNKKLIDIKLIRTQSIEGDQLQEMIKGWNYEKFIDIAKGKSYAKPLNGKRYTLYCWNGSWTVVGSTHAANNVVDFKAVPSNGLYLLSSKESISNERPFIILNDSIKWL